MISFIIPAHNEEAWVGRCVSSIHRAIELLGSRACEILVVDDSSTDRTASVAEENGARVIRVGHRHISATRNTGAKAARGDVLFFVDADTIVGASGIQSALKAMRDGAAGGGFVPRYDGILPLWFRLVYPFFVVVVRLLRQPGGSCLFCSRSGFEAIGGFSEAHFAAEDAVFVTALKRHGQFVVPRHRVITSGRNLRVHSFWSFLRLLLRLASRGPNGFRDRRGLDIWYSPVRHKS